jgi:ABC-type Mn2+/Zn2+ transport system ATPase subunit
VNSTPAPISRLVAQHLQKSYISRTVVHDVSISVAKGEVVGLLGPNGAGKTTSFYMIVGLLRADAGTISIDGQSVEDLPIHRRARMGLSYLPTLTPQIQAQSRAIPTHRAFLEYLLSKFPTKINPFREANPLQSPSKAI